ncbi:PASTA domain-containing protein [Actinocrispum wychmicini]|uniref:PASTA domain-containing protein n=1 Tax=Actinocrispum wychmicini TaxID=1213861 RepID=A0A4R2KDB8_9PSEU|nr:PASTA domain-containing protein [Actinocrispum wychmicini]TCO64505.1 PASTA domain-containing protein [Actinocrispum wychmicini]
MRKAWLAGALLLAACSATPTETPAAAPAAAPEPVLGQTVVRGTKAPSGNLVPDVVGKNREDARRTLQASGFYNFTDEDATGRGRMIIVDRNWQVVSQEPPGGAALDPKQEVLLRSKKYTD